MRPSLLRMGYLKTKSVGWKWSTHTYRIPKLRTYCFQATTAFVPFRAIHHDLFARPWFRYFYPWNLAIVLVQFHLCILHAYMIGSPTTLRAKPFPNNEASCECYKSMVVQSGNWEKESKVWLAIDAEADWFQWMPSSLGIKGSSLTRKSNYDVWSGSGWHEN